MEMNKLYRCIIIVLSLGVAAFFMSGCSTMQEKNPILIDAYDVFAQVQSDPKVNRYAPVELKDAKTAIENAQKSWETGSDPDEVEHLAYLAKQKALIANEVASMKIADKGMETASSERNKVLLGIRTNEADLSLREAQQLTAEAEKARQEALAAEERARYLEAQIADLEAKQTERGLVLTLGDVLFDTAKSELKPGAFVIIDKLAAFMKEYPKRRVLIEGFTDSVGSDEYNLGLSIRRAQAVRNALYGRGIELDRILYRGYGEMYPVASNDTAAGRQQNRRVEIVISDEKGVISERMR
ncbi:MAG: OmpA family protein [Bacteroidales bacterium]